MEDLYKWDRALHTENILSEEMKNLMFKKENIYGGYGYGWFVMVGGKIVEHNGGIFGFATHIGRNMIKGNVVILLSNCQNVDISALGKKINRNLINTEVLN